MVVVHLPRSLRASPALVGGAILALAVILLAIPAGRRPIYSQDEARQLLLARDVMEQGHWLVAEVRGRPYLNKPQLYFWSIAAASLPFGEVTETTAAVPSVLAAVATVAAVMVAARTLWGPSAAVLAGLVLVATPAHFELGNAILPDAMLTAWLTWALAAYLTAAHAGWPRRHVSLFYGCVAGALLTKGPVALLALLAAVVATACTDGRAGLARLRIGRGLGVLALAALPWAVPYYLRGRAAFAQGTAYDQYVRWVVFNSEAHGSSDILDRLGHLAFALPAFFPWTLALVVAALAWRRTADPSRRRLAFWTLTMWIAIGLSGTFRTRYLLPLYPAFALLVAAFVTTAERRSDRRLVGAALGATALVVVGASIVLVAFGHLIRGETRVFLPDTSWERAVFLILGVMGGGAALVLVARSAFVRAAAVLALTVSAALAVAGFAFPVRYARAYDLRALAATIVREAATGAAVVGHPDLRLSYDFYVRRDGVEAASADALRARLTDPAPAVIVTPETRWRNVSAGAPPDWRVVHVDTVADRRIVVVARRPR